ncbi:MAG: hypothetical protein ACE5RC_06285, partial [Nitrosopumilus sp.]
LVALALVALALVALALVALALVALALVALALVAFFSGVFLVVFFTVFFSAMNVENQEVGWLLKIMQNKVALKIIKINRSGSTSGSIIN